ncbi:MAG: hypothetical protein HN352_08990 [Bacteroidetes bacterium]|nr:hypothetical protein [Bacteroidota bacterium]MBT4401924.1 hypothetical protein [Bacteroidota bacterium]MBT4410125.1 hypothetical protein [Bacteroidota bacterium]MBT5427898.1 hypothetical protein [Bacteroidota bacterium]MBT7466417.1 hypothetical protein [Bacteroidota bacterium]
MPTTDIDHYESIFHADEDYAYLAVKTAGVDNQLGEWRNPDFDDSEWPTGSGGIGFGDDDDGTMISRSYSVYMRKWFNIDDLPDIEKLILIADYDDGFVVYLNGTEIARANMPANDAFPGYNTRASSSHEAKMYSGGYPEPFIIDSAAMAGSLLSGNNLFAVQVHNESSSSRDLSSNFYLIAGVISSDHNYKPVPEWFTQMESHYSSNLPLIVIDTYGDEIPDEPKISGWMTVTNNQNGQLNSIFDLPNEYKGHIAIEQRGYSSRWMYVDDGKISYSLETQDSVGENNNIPLLGMPSENDWILYGPYSDKSLIKNVLAYWMGNNLGQWAPRTQYVDVVLNGKQMGIFAFMEKVKRDKDRVNISKIDDDDNEADSLSGGYLIKVDRGSGVPNETWDSPYPPSNAIDQTVTWVLVYPRPEVATPEQFNYIREYITGFESLMASENYMDPLDGYRKMINVDSFVDFFLIAELFRDADAFRSSMYLHKDRDSRDPLLQMGPLWDFNYSMSNYDICACYSSSGWSYLFNYYCNERYKINPFWWEKIVEDEYFKEKAITRWNTLRDSSLNEAVIFNFIDSTTNYIEESRIRNFEIWPILNTTLWPNYYVGGTYENEIEWLKKWIHERLIWLDQNIPRIGSTGIESDLISENCKISVYPNPASDLASFKFENTGPGNLVIEIYSPLGQKVDEIQNELGYNGTWLIPYTIKKRDNSHAPGSYYCRFLLNSIEIGVAHMLIR